MPIQHVGRPIKRLEDPKLIQGRDPYVNDVKLPGALSLAFARSPHAHAVIKRIDTTAAKKIPGVVAEYKQRQEQGCTLGHIFQACSAGSPEDPSTPLIQAHAGDPVRIHVIGAWSEQNGMFGVEGHEWPIEPYMAGADMISVVEFAGSEVLDAFLREGAGGPYRLAGDYVWSNQRLPYSQSGQWGYFRVLPVGDQRILPLSSGVVGGQKAQVEPAPPIAMPISGTSTEAQMLK